MERALYPPNWPELRRACLERAGYKCEICGAKQGARRKSRRTGDYYKVYLSAAHKNADVWNSSPDVELLCACQRCHLIYDQRLHFARMTALRLRRMGRSSFHAPLGWAKVYSGNGDDPRQPSLGGARNFAEIFQIACTTVTIGEVFTVELEMNHCFVGAARYVKTPDGLTILEETGAAETLHINFGVPCTPALDKRKEGPAHGDTIAVS
jgi:hypothetical protein